MKTKKIYCPKCDKIVNYCTDYVGDRKSMVKFCNECDSRIEEKYKLCILAAGKGTRNTSVVGLHKALLPIENKAVISHIIKSVPDTIEIVIAIGYISKQVKSYVNHVFPKRDITFVDIENYDGPGSGPGLSLLKCKDYLQSPFIFTSVDTIVKETFVFNELEENWLGVSHVSLEDSLKYCLVKGSKYLDSLYYGTGNRAYVGMAGIYDYKDYWKSLEDHKIIKDEYQVVHGFDGLNKIRLIDFTWYDTGNNEAYEKTRKHFPNEVVAAKNKEAIFIDEGKVIKYFDNPKIRDLRIERTKYLNGNCPTVEEVNENMYSYDYIKGKMLSNITDETVLRQFLDNCQEKLFIRRDTDMDSFIDDCRQMNEIKTKDRIKSLSGSSLDRITIINGIKVEPIDDMLNKIDWNRFYENAIPSYFHGDLQPENILYDEHNDKFVLIDWRQSFGKSLEIGDVYYDLGKLHHDLLINGQSILKDMFDYNIEGDSVSVEFYAKSNLVYFIDIFKKFCDENNYIWSNVELLSILQYINICTLYDNFKDGKYGNFLFLYGKYLLAKFLNEKK